MCALGDARLGTYNSMHNAAVYQESGILTLGSFLWLGTPGTRGLIIDLPVKTQLHYQATGNAGKRAGLGILIPVNAGLPFVGAPK